MKPEVTMAVPDHIENKAKSVLNVCKLLLFFESKQNKSLLNVQ